MIDGEFHEMAGIVDVELLHDIRAVGIDGPWANEEFFADLLVIQTCCDERKNFSFSFRKCGTGAFQIA